MNNENQLETWTITVELGVFAGNMDKESVISIAEKLLTDMIDGSDFAGCTIIKAERDEL